MIRIGNFMPQPSVLGAKKIGQLWTPKKYTNFAQIDRTVEDFIDDPITQVVGDTATIRKSAQAKYMAARSDARMGFGQLGFSRQSDIDVIAPNRLQPHEDREQRLVATNNATVTLLSGSIRIDYTDGRESQTVKLDQNVRISWDNKGDPLVQTGAAALTGGKLKAGGANEVLVRLTGVNVEAGENSTVVNFSDIGGRFSGGSNVTYQGAYTDSVFEYKFGVANFAGLFTSSSITTGNDKAVFRGVFESTTIETGDAVNQFSGHFRGGSILAGNGVQITRDNGDMLRHGNVFSGLFFEQIDIKSGSSDDKFIGRFIDAVIDGGDGDNEFGPGFMMAELATMDSGFTNSIISAGSGNDSFFSAAYDSRINLGDGDNSTKGVFMNSAVSTGSGNDHLTAMYSRNSVFDSGEGDDFVALGTAMANKIILNSGVNEVVLGYNIDDRHGNPSSIYGGDSRLTKSKWITSTEFANGLAAKEFGEIRGNMVDASQGENTITVNSGEGTHTVRSGEAKNEKEDDKENAVNGVGERLGEKLEELDKEASTAMIDKINERGGDVILPGASPDGKDADESETDDEIFSLEEVQRFLDVSGSLPRKDGVIGVIIDGGVDEIIALRAHDRRAFVAKFYKDGEKSMAGYDSAFNGVFKLL